VLQALREQRARLAQLGLRVTQARVAQQV
jgi:hypothetical protein